MDSTRASRAEDVIGRMRQSRGGDIYPEWEYAARLDPGFVDKYSDLTSHILGSAPRRLDEKTRELVFVAVVAVIGEPQGLRAHMARAMTAGAGRDDVLEVLETILPPAGVPAFLRGVRVLMELESDAAPQADG